MLRANRRTLFITSIITLLPILIGVITWNRLPDVMATHFGMENEADGFSSKVFAVFGLPLFLLAMEWLAAVVTSKDPRRQNISPKMFKLVLWIIPAVSVFCAAVIYPYNLGMSVDISFIAMMLVGLMFIVIGNYLPKARQNYTIGIRLPWTLADEENWNRTHRLGGYLWVAGGVLMILMCLTGFARAPWVFGILIALTIIPCVYSFWLYAQTKQD